MAVAQWVELVDWWSEGHKFEVLAPLGGTELHVEVARYWTPKLLLMCRCHQ